MKDCFRLLLLAVACVCLSVAQQSDSIPGSLANSSNSQESQDSGLSLADQARRLRRDHSEERQMTEDDAKKLFAAVDRIVNFAAQDSGFPLHSTVKRRMISPDDLEKFEREKLSKHEYDERFERSELTMKKFGLLPRDFNLKEFLVKADRTEIAAFYDDETKIISMLNTIPFEQQEPILAHELTHALQDQNYDLQKWLRRGDTSANVNDESIAARRAIVEGQATVVYLDYLLARIGRSVADTPGIVYRMEDPAVKYAIDSQLMHAAPMILREWGAFPYHDGLIFENELLQSGGKKLAFPEAFAHPPRTTHEVLQPKAYLDHQAIAPIAIPDARVILGSEYELFDSGSLGELDVRALLWQLGTRTLADDLSTKWQGGSYAAYRKKSPAAVASADLRLLYVSRWSTADAALRFAKFYAKAVARRYETATPATNTACISGDCPLSSTLISTEEGPVMIDLWKDNTVLVSESFDQASAAKLVNASRDLTQKSAMMFPAQQELGMRLDAVPAFREFQDLVGRELVSTVYFKSIK
ncbi:MAG TPA: hypothetical protein VH596_00445 [Terriglobales bacterium]